MIKLRGVSLVYPNGVRALDDVDLEIEKGSFVFLVGHSGTGKSSLLKLLYREELPSSGQVVVDDIRVDTLRRGRVPKLRRNIGVVFQDFKLLSHKTVWENVAFALQVTGTRTRDVMRMVPRALDLVGLSHKSRMFPSELAGAGRQSETAALRRADRKSRSVEHGRDHGTAPAHQPQGNNRGGRDAQSTRRRPDAAPRRTSRTRQDSPRR